MVAQCSPDGLMNSRQKWGFAPRPYGTICACCAGWLGMGQFTKARGKRKDRVAQRHPALSFFFVVLSTLKIFPAIFGHDAVNLFDSPLHAHRVSSAPACPQDGFQPQIKRDAAHCINFSPELVKIAEYGPCFGIPLGQFCGPLAGCAWRLVAVQLVQLPAVVTLRTAGVAVPFGPLRQFFTSSSSPMRATLRMRSIRPPVNSESHSHISLITSGVQGNGSLFTS